MSIFTVECLTVYIVILSHAKSNISGNIQSISKNLRVGYLAYKRKIQTLTIICTVVVAKKSKTLISQIQVEHSVA